MLRLGLGLGLGLDFDNALETMDMAFMCTCVSDVVCVGRCIR